MVRLFGFALALSILSACNHDAKPTVDASLDAAAATLVADAAVDANVIEAAAPDDEMPDRASASLTLRARHLLEAISKNSADLGTDMLFPRDGYVAMRDEKDPAKSWDNKVKPAFQKAIANLFKRTKGVDQAVFVSFDLGHQAERVAPRKKEWKEPCWRVKHGTLTFTVGGKSERIEVAEMVSWRGNWYVTRLR